MPPSFKAPQVRIIPWVHKVDYPLHADVVEHIRSLPKESSLAIELTEGDRIYHERFLNNLKIEDAETLPKPTLAMLEIMHECQMRGIKLIPIDSRASYNRRTKIPYGVVGSRGEDIWPGFGKGMDYTDEVFADRLKKLLLNHKCPVLPVLVGFSHTLGLRDNLSSQEVQAHIDTSIFKDKKDAEEHMNLERLRKKALAEKDLKAYGETLLRLKELFETNHRNEFKREIVARILKARRRKETVRRRKLAKRLEKRRRKT